MAPRHYRPRPAVSVLPYVNVTDGSDIKLLAVADVVEKETFRTDNLGDGVGM